MSNAQSFVVDDAKSETAPGQRRDDAADSETIERLARLSTLDYDRNRESEAKTMGVRVATLDKAVAAARPSENGEDTGGEALFDKIEPWPEPVSGAALLHQIAAAARRYIVLPPGGAELLALWVVHSHCVTAFFHSPRLAVMSPEKRCGKSMVLDLLEVLVPRPLKTENFSPAVLFRVAEGFDPVILADEVDGFLKANPELVSLMNAGAKQGGKAVRCEGDDNHIKFFHVFGALALAGIGTLPAALGDRCINLTMRRATKAESPAPFRTDRTEHECELARMCARWAADNVGALRDMDPAMPSWMFNRVADNWRSLFAVAQRCGGDWPELVVTVAVQTTAVEASETSYREMVLMDIAEIFNAIGADRVPSEELVRRLAEIETRPWGEYGRQKKPISKTQLANLLRPLDISPGAVRTATENLKGYRLEQFKDAFARYTPSQGVTPSQPALTIASSPNLAVTQGDDVTAGKSSKPAVTGTCDGVTAGSPLGWEKGL